MSQIVTIKLTKNQIIITLDQNSTYKEVLKNLKKKLPELKNLYKDDKTPIFITGKVLKNKEITEIKELINKEIDVEIEIDSPEVLGLYGIKRTYNEDIGESLSIYHRGDLRSGQKLENEGSIVIIGDVKSGAEIIAGENIIILGKLRGLAHAGAKGNNKAIIAAESIDVPQIRISNIVREMEKKDEEYSVKYKYAFVDNDKIELE